MYVLAFKSIKFGKAVERNKSSMKAIKKMGWDGEKENCSMIMVLSMKEVLFKIIGMG